MLTPPTQPEAAAGFGTALAEAVAARERQLQEQARDEGRSFLGARAVLRQRRDSRPATQAPRRGLDPAIAAADPHLRVRLLDALIAFRERYRQALDAWRQGARAVLFPAGTYAMRVHHDAACRPPPEPLTT